MRRGRTKILFLIDELQVGGTEKQLVILSEGLLRDRYEPVIGVLQGDIHPNFRNIRTPIVSFRWGGLPFFKNARLFGQLYNYISKQNFDIVQTQYIDSTIYGSWAVRFCNPRPRLVTTRRNMYHWIQDDPWSFRFMRSTARWTDRIIVNSHKVFEACRSLEGMPAEKIVFIPNAVKTEKFRSISSDEAKKRMGLDGEYPVVGVVGNYRPVKGLMSFIDSAVVIRKEIPSARFVLVGKGPQEDDLRSCVSQLGMADTFTFLDNTTDIPTAITAFDVAVQTSLSESRSNVLLEYMAAARPIVATRVGDAEAMIVHGKEGLLVEPGDVRELSEKIITLCRNAAKATELGRAARLKVESNWTSASIVSAYDNFYQALVKS